MKISVVMVCRNSSATIGRALESFFVQDHLDKELIVVDGASTDRTLDVIASFPAEGVTVISEPDAGMYDAMNKGLAAFDGEAVGFLNSDDCYRDNGVLSDIVKALADHDAVHGNVDFVSSARDQRVVRRWRGSPYRYGAFKTGWMPPHPTFYIRRSVVETVGRFDLRFAIAADYDFMLRALEVHGFRSAYVDRVFVEMCLGGASTASVRAVLQGNLESLRARRKWLNAGLIDRALIAKPLQKMTQLFPGRSGGGERAR